MKWLYLSEDILNLTPDEFNLMGYFLSTKSYSWTGAKEITRFSEARIRRIIRSLRTKEIVDADRLAPEYVRLVGLQPKKELKMNKSHAQCGKLTSTEKRVLAQLALFSDENGVGYILLRRRDICRFTGLSKLKVLRSLKKLQYHGIIHYKSDHGKITWRLFDIGWMFRLFG